eukprot:scaffold1827_cov421-Prasinococcus_capsulatus_cf.AAC.18
MVLSRALPTKCAFHPLNSCVEHAIVLITRRVLNHGEVNLRSVALSSAPLLSPTHVRAHRLLMDQISCRMLAFHLQGWWCAQRLIVQSQADGLERARRYLDILEDTGVNFFVLILDSDTIVNVYRLYQELLTIMDSESHDENRKGMYGSMYRKVVMGGAMLLSRDAVLALTNDGSRSPLLQHELELMKQRLRQHAQGQGHIAKKFQSFLDSWEGKTQQASIISACASLMQGGKFCWWHADWVISYCADAIGIRLHWSPYMMQFCPDADMGKSLAEETLRHYRHDAQKQLKDTLVMPRRTPVAPPGPHPLHILTFIVLPGAILRRTRQLNATQYDSAQAWISCHNASPERIRIVDGWLSGTNRSAPVGLLEPGHQRSGRLPTDSQLEAEIMMTLQEESLTNDDWEDLTPTRLRSVLPEHRDCLLTHLANMEDHSFFENKDSLLVISIGSESRPSFIETQWNTWASRKFDSCLFFVGYTETRRFANGVWQRLKKDFTCDTRDLEGCPDDIGRVEEIPGRMQPWLKKEKGWWCAQRRPLHALDDMKGLLMSFRWVMVVDDDTYVRLDRLQQTLLQLRQEYKDAPIVTAVTMRSSIMGGAGYVLSRSLLRERASRIPECLQNAQRGDWCHWHSDWSITQCFVEEWAARGTNRSKALESQWLLNHDNLDSVPSMVHDYRFKQICFDGDIGNSKSLTYNSWMAKRFGYDEAADILRSRPPLLSDEQIGKILSTLEQRVIPAKSKDGGSPLLPIEFYNSSAAWLSCHNVSPTRSISLMKAFAAFE